MNDKYVVIPSTGIKIFEGSVVFLPLFPDTKWTVKCGWYKYNTQSVNGWYLSSVPDKSIIPLKEDMLEGAQIISNVDPDDYPCPRPPHPGPFPPGPIPPGPRPPHPGPFPPHPGPFPPGPPVRPFTVIDADHLSRAAVVFDTVVERDALYSEYIPHGKVVRVNNNESGHPEYFQYNAVTSEWEPLDLGSLVMSREESDVAFEEVNEKLETIDEAVAEINEDIDAIADVLTWGSI